MADQDHDKPQIDPVSGIATTGHEWDGLTELNHPLPRWWLWIFFATIIFSVGYWVVYPSWPLFSSYAGGFSGWRSRSAVVEDIAALQAARGPMVAKLAAAPVADVEKDHALFDFALAYGHAAFRENCAPCHGAGGGGGPGYPNLVDDDWLWGGAVDAIGTTITHGVRNADPDSRQTQMPAFGREGTLQASEIQTVAAYVRSLSGLEIPQDANLPAGAQLFADHCAGCHGEGAKGNPDIGAPNLTDAVWLYGSDQNDVVTTITNARNSSMPAWGARLDATTIKALSLYVHALGGSE